MLRPPSPRLDEKESTGVGPRAALAAAAQDLRSKIASKQAAAAAARDPVLLEEERSSCTDDAMLVDDGGQSHASLKEASDRDSHTGQLPPPMGATVQII